MSNHIETLRELATRGIAERGHGKDIAYAKQLYYELTVIEELGFAPVFLICHNLCQFAKDTHIRMGPGRGSAAASLVCYSLGITHLDPIKYGLDFSRFLIAGRISPPDIDLDIESTGRAKILRRLRDIVGDANVCKITTFATYHERGALREAARILIEDDSRYELLKRDINIISNLIPMGKTEGLDALVKGKPLSSYYKRYPKLFRLAKRLIGLPRHEGIHAAGVILSDKPLAEIIPLRRDPEDDSIPVSQWEMEDTDKFHLFKLDLLSLKGLDFLTEACALAGVDVQGIEPNDPAIFAAFAAGEIRGIFQFDAPYVAEIFSRIGCDRFDDLVATNALLRPGAKATNSVDQYAANKRRGDWISSLPKVAHECVSDTYGLILYQEQAMKIARVCARFTIAEADALRKGIAKDYDTSGVKDDFLKGCADNGISEADAASLWRVLAAAGRYMFNKAHSTCYSYLAYQMMYLKVHHPKAFWAGLLNVDIGEEEKVRAIAKEMRKRGMRIASIRAHRSKAKCWYDADRDEIVLGFRCIKGIGDRAGAELERLRDCRTIEEWSSASDRRILRKDLISLLIEYGVFSHWSKDEEYLRSKLVEKHERGQNIEDVYPAEQTQMALDFPGQEKSQKG